VVDHASIASKHDPPRERSKHWCSGAIGDSKKRKTAEMIMSTSSSAPAAAQGTTGHSWTGGLAAALKRWWMAFITWRLEQAAINQLRSLSDRQLKDIGLDRSEIIGAVRNQVTRGHTLSRCS
jgi:uncharacterized protein YjiS (DUF1127 family)